VLRTIASIIVLVSIAGCGSSREAASGEPMFEDSALGVRVALPASWQGRYTIERDTLTGLPALRVWLFQYHPRDTAIVPQTLMAIAVYDTASWRRVSAEDGPPVGEVVRTAGGRVAVVGWPQSNPFPPGADSATFDSLQFPHEQLARRLTLH
jgi:hypothetical protein